MQFEPNRLTPERAGEAVFERTSLVRAHNESDYGTFGTDNLGRHLTNALGIRTASFV